jgi:hypothetical protein
LHDAGSPLGIFGQTQRARSLRRYRGFMIGAEIQVRYGGYKHLEAELLVKRHGHI